MLERSKNMNTIVKPNPEMVDDENPEWTDEMFSHAKNISEIPEMQAFIKSNRGRPKSNHPKKSISIRLSPDVLDYFKSTGKGWQTRIDKILTDYVSEQ